MHRLIGRVRKLETLVPRHRTMTPAARQQRTNELLVKLDVAPEELDAVSTALVAMSAAERQAWIAARGTPADTTS